jgi:hypothetical protein
MVMAVADNNGDGGQQRWRMMMAADDDGLQDWAADYDGEGQEQAARDGRYSGVVIMAAAKMAVTKMAVAEDSGNGGKGQRRTKTACKIGRQHTMEKVESKQQTMTALGIKRRRQCCFWRGSYNFLL